jgi:hypothetical protein
MSELFGGAGSRVEIDCVCCRGLEEINKFMVAVNERGHRIINIETVFEYADMEYSREKSLFRVWYERVVIF